MRAVGQRRKYGNRPTEYAGVTYHSAKEALFAAELDILVRAGELRCWRRQPTWDLTCNGVVICKIAVDFILIWPDETMEAVEVKGYPTAEWRLKWKLFDALYPNIKKRVV